VIDTQQFRPSPDATTMLWTDDTHIGPTGFVFRSLVSYANDPLVYAYEEGRTVGLVSDLVQVDILPSVRFWRARIGLDVPLYPSVYTREQRVIFGEGDWRVEGRVVVLDGAVAPLGVGVAGSLGLPMGTTDGLRSGGFSGDAAIVLDKAQGKTRVAANLGFRATPQRHLENLDLQDSVTARLGGSYALSIISGVNAELIGAAPIGESVTTPGVLYAEWMAGGWYRNQSLVIRAGFGTGLTRGIGSPDMRVVLGFGWERRDGPPDKDADGVPNKEDRCQQDPEDDDGFADTDGCPDPDNDDDRVRDAEDQCPEEPEDHDRIDDGDGCPE
jgi:hypothetical protein